MTDYPIYMLSLDGTITNWNPGARPITGFTQTEAVGTHFSRFYIEEDKAEGLPLVALQTTEAEGCFEGESWRVRKDGFRFWVNVVIGPIRNDLGELMGFAKITRDIMEKREAEQALERAKKPCSSPRNWKRSAN